MPDATKVCITRKQIEQAIIASEILTKISDHQQSWGYEEGPWKGPGPCSAGGR